MKNFLYLLFFTFVNTSFAQVPTDMKLAKKRVDKEKEVEHQTNNVTKKKQIIKKK